MSDSPIVHVDHDAEKIYYRASSLGSCSRRLLAARQGLAPVPPPAALQKAFDEGHELEASILYDLVKTYGWEIKEGSQQAECSISIGWNEDGYELVVVGHVDALGRPYGAYEKWMPIDAKAFAQSTFDQFQANGIRSFPHYYYQQNAYAVGFDATQYCLPLWNKDKKQMGAVRVFDVDPDEAYELICGKVWEIENLVKDRIPVTNVDCPGTWGCPYPYLHDSKPVDQLSPDLIDRVEAYTALKRKIDALTTARKAIGDALLSDLQGEGDASTFVGGGFTVSLVNNPKRLNTQKVKELLTEAGLPLEDYYTPGEGVSMRIKENGENG